MSTNNELTLRAWHHGYLGILIIALGLWLHWPWWVIAKGATLLLDDLLQHTVQIITKNPNWQSPLKRLYGWVYARVPLVRRVNAWLDSLFGR